VHCESEVSADITTDVGVPAKSAGAVDGVCQEVCVSGVI
jgi:hypothetical protein